MKCHGSHRPPPAFGLAVHGAGWLAIAIFGAGFSESASAQATQATQAEPSPAPLPAGAAQTPAAPEPSAKPAVPLHTWLADKRDALGRTCDLKELLARGDLRYIACGQAGLWIVRQAADASFALVSQHAQQGSVERVMERDGSIWAQVVTVRAVRVALVSGEALPQPPALAPGTRAQPTTAPASSAPARPNEAPPPHDMRVIEVGPGYAIIDGGISAYVTRDTHIAFLETVSEEVVAGHRAVRTRLIGVGRVDSASQERARIELGPNERIPVGARAERTSLPLSRSVVAPPRVSELWEFGFLARPFIAIDDLGGGAIIDAWASRRMAGPWSVQAQIAPFAFGTAEEGGVVPAAAYLLATLDLRLFEVGLGLGGETVNSPAFDLEAGSGIGIVQHVRIGARDGLNLSAQTHVVLFHSEFEFSAARVRLQIPFNGRTWLIAGGGGGDIGFGYGEAGLRTLLAGNGNRGSLFLTAVFGGAAVFQDENCFTSPDCEDRDFEYLGPMLGVGAEWRE